MKFLLAFLVVITCTPSLAQMGRGQEGHSGGTRTEAMAELRVEFSKFFSESDVLGLSYNEKKLALKELKSFFRWVEQNSKKNSTINSKLDQLSLNSLVLLALGKKFNRFELITILSAYQNYVYESLLRSRVEDVF